ncbi:MAG: hypothetical protein ACR2FX_08600 [Chthoniobacterales bacterium]
MTDSAVDVEAFASARQQLARDRHGKGRGEIVPDFAGVELLIFVQLTARDGVRWRNA